MKFKSSCSENCSSQGLSQVPEGRHVFSGLTVLENLEMGAFLKTNRDENQANLKKVFTFFRVWKSVKNQDAATLSGGEQQMHLLWDELLCLRPNSCFLDEPSMGLALSLHSRNFDIIQDIQKQRHNYSID